MTKEQLKTISAIAGIVFGLVGVSIGVSNYVADQAKLQVDIEYVGFNAVRGEDVARSLVDIESESGRATGNLIGELKKTAESIDWMTVKGADDFRAELQRSARRLDAGEVYDTSSVSIDGMIVSWPRGESIDLSNPVEAGDFPKALINKLRTGEAQEADKDKVKEIALPLLRGQETEEDREAAQVAAQKLRELRQKFEAFVSDTDRHLVGTLRVVNKSRLPTFVMSDAVAVCFKSSGESPVVPFLVLEGGSIERYEAKKLHLRSPPLGSFDHNKFFAPNVDQPTIRCSIGLEDIHGNQWGSTGHFGELDAAKSTATLVDYAKRLALKSPLQREEVQ